MQRFFYSISITTTIILTFAGNAWAGTATPEAFRAWLGLFRNVAVGHGIKPDLYDRLTSNLRPDFELPDLQVESRSSKKEQPEFVRTPEQYLSEKTLASLANQGKNLLAKYHATLTGIESMFGVDPKLLLALWGRETAFGDYHLPYNALQVLAVQSYIGNRAELFRAEFIDALRMVQEGVIEPENMRSSWAGAMGLIQFMPSDYWKYGVKFEGRGKPDIWHSVPDALASLAKNISKIGWQPGELWGYEVRVPHSIDCSLAKLDTIKQVSEWEALGVKPIRSGGRNMQNAQASLLMPAGSFGPAFLTFKNFQVIREYNRSDLYALFVGHLADRIGGSGSFSQPWEKVVQVPSRDVEYLQEQLREAGLYQDTVDGKAGGKTRAAVGLLQKALGLKQTCWPTDETVAFVKRRLLSGPLIEQARKEQVAEPRSTKNTASSQMDTISSPKVQNCEPSQIFSATAWHRECRYVSGKNSCKLVKRDIRGNSGGQFEMVATVSYEPSPALNFYVKWNGEIVREIRILTQINTDFPVDVSAPVCTDEGCHARVLIQDGFEDFLGSQDMIGVQILTETSEGTSQLPVAGLVRYVECLSPALVGTGN